MVLRNHTHKVTELFLSTALSPGLGPASKVLFTEADSTGTRGSTDCYMGNRPARPTESVWSIFPRARRCAVDTAALPEAVV